MIYIFLLFILIIVVIGLIPSIISEDKLHNIVANLYLYEKTNLDILHEEVHSKKNLIQRTLHNGTSLENSHSMYYFAHPVVITFDIDSSYRGGKTKKKFHNVDALTIFALHGDIECRVESGTDSKSVFIFEDTHKLKVNIESEAED